MVKIMKYRKTISILLIILIPVISFMIYYHITNVGKTLRYANFSGLVYQDSVYQQMDSDLVYDYELNDNLGYVDVGLSGLVFRESLWTIKNDDNNTFLIMGGIESPVVYCKADSYDRYKEQIKNGTFLNKPCLNDGKTTIPLTDEVYNDLQQLKDTDAEKIIFRISSLDDEIHNEYNVYLYDSLLTFYIPKGMIVSISGELYYVDYRIQDTVSEGNLGLKLTPEISHYIKEQQK